MSLMRMLSAGPIVSPTTTASCALVSLPILAPNRSAPMYLLVLSYAPPALAMNPASMKPEVSAPTSSLPSR